MKEEEKKLTSELLGTARLIKGDEKKSISEHSGTGEQIGVPMEEEKKSISELSGTGKPMEGERKKPYVSTQLASNTRYEAKLPNNQEYM